MEQLNTVIFDIVIEFLLIFLLYSDTIKTSLYKFYTCAVIFFFSVVLLYVLPNMASPLIDFFLEMLLVFILLTDKWYNKIVSFVLVYILDSLLYQALALICDLILGFPIFVGMNTVKEKNIIKTIVILILAIALFIKIRKKYHFSLSLKNKIFICGYTGTICIILSISQLYQNLINSYFLYSFALLCIVSSGIILAYIISLSERNINYENLQKQTQYINILKHYYNETKEKNLEIRKLKHDIKNQVNVLSQLLESENYKEALNYIDSLKKHTLNKTPSIIDTGNVLVNAIIMQKQAEYPDIKIISKGAIRNNLTVNDYDLCSILNNLLDNALEYSAKNNFSTVWLNIYLEASVLLIDVVNNISAPLDISKFSSTTKADNINHGLGLAIVKETVHYYNGSLKYELSESQITAKVRLFTVA